MLITAQDCASAGSTHRVSGHHMLIQGVGSAAAELCMAVQACQAWAPRCVSQAHTSLSKNFCKAPSLQASLQAGAPALRQKSTRSARGTNSSVRRCCLSRITFVPGVSTMFTCTPLSALAPSQSCRALSSRAMCMARGHSAGCELTGILILADSSAAAGHGSNHTMADHYLTA